MTVVRDTESSWEGGSDANFQEWVQGIHDALAGCGLAQASDTGQIDPETVSLPGSNDTSGGYEIWRFNDAEQATNPIFIRLDYFRGDSASELRLNFGVGKGSNGSGTLTDAMSITPSVSAGGVDSVERLIHASFTDGALCFLATPDQTSASAESIFLLIIEREKDTEGEFNGIVNVAGRSGTADFGGRWDSAWTTSGLFCPLIPEKVGPDGEVQVGLGYFAGSPVPCRSVAVAADTLIGQGDSGTIEVDGEERAMIGVCEVSLLTETFWSLSAVGSSMGNPGSSGGRGLIRNE